MLKWIPLNYFFFFTKAGLFFTIFEIFDSYMRKSYWLF